MPRVPAIASFMRQDYSGRRNAPMSITSLLSNAEKTLPEGLRFLEEMVGLESPSFDKALTDKLSSFIAAEFRGTGGHVELIRTAKFGDHLRVTFSGKADRRILLLGHMDTVWPAGEIHQRPFTI